MVIIFLCVSCAHFYTCVSGKGQRPFGSNNMARGLKLWRRLYVCLCLQVCLHTQKMQYTIIRKYSEHNRRDLYLEDTEFFLFSFFFNCKFFMRRTLSSKERKLQQRQLLLKQKQLFCCLFLQFLLSQFYRHYFYIYAHENSNHLCSFY